LYLSRDYAESALANTKTTPGRHERNAYRCPHCIGWHLTSQRPKVTLSLEDVGRADLVGAPTPVPRALPYRGVLPSEIEAAC
jgi:hypothetical protein